MASDNDNQSRQNDSANRRQQTDQSQHSQEQPQQQPPQQPQGQQPPQQPQGQQPQGQQPPQQPQGQQPPRQPQGQQPPQQPQGQQPPQQPQGQQPPQRPQGQQPPQQPQGQPVQDDGIDVIAPLSDELLDHVDHVFPDQWSDDETTLEVVQWVVYLFFHETDDSADAAKRMREAMEMAADRFETDRKTINRVCTTTLYRDEDDDPASAFHTDIRLIHDLYQS